MKKRYLVSSIVQSFGDQHQRCLGYFVSVSGQGPYKGGGYNRQKMQILASLYLYCCVCSRFVFLPICDSVYPVFVPAVSFPFV